MNGSRLERMDEMLIKDEDTDTIIAALRDDFLEVDEVNKVIGYDITSEIASCPKHVLFYVARYISKLEHELMERTCFDE